ncbi:hypothetical protein JCM16303_006144 [Sporobolomyces ruberrimus]
MIATSSSLNLPRGSTLIEDADEEIFLLYTRKQQSSHSINEVSAKKGARPSGLGFHSDQGDVLNLTITVEDPLNDPTESTVQKKGKKGKGKQKASFEVEVELHQSLANLRHRTGDTGSVLWRLSLHFAKYLLTSHHYPHPTLSPPLLPHLSTSKILELGSGTGFLGIALRSIFTHDKSSCPKSPPPPSRNSTPPRTSPKNLLSALPTTAPSPFRWTFSDQFENLSLILRNLRSNSISPSSIGETLDQPYSVIELDWLVESKRFLKTRSLTNKKEEEEEEEDDDKPDLILAIDCIYNPSLSQPLAHTILNQSKKSTITVVASELRDSEPLEVFLRCFLEEGEKKFGEGRWKVARLGCEEEKEGDEHGVTERKGGEGGGGGELEDSKFVVWVAWCE